MTLGSEKISKIMGVICLFSVAVFMASLILELLVTVKNTVKENDGSKNG